MFRITEDPSSGSLVQCLAIYTLLYPFHVVLAVNLSLKQTVLFFIQLQSQYAAITPTLSMSTTR